MEAMYIGIIVVALIVVLIVIFGKKRNAPSKGGTGWPSAKLEAGE